MTEFGTGSSASAGAAVPDDTDAPLLPTGAAAPTTEDDMTMTTKTIPARTLTVAEIEREIVAALTETDPEGHSMTKFLPIRRELERRPGIAYAAPVTALLSLWERGEVEVITVRGSAYVKLSDTFDRTPDHPAAIARGEHRRLMVI